MSETDLLSIIALIVSVGGMIVGVINHKRIRSNCCGKNIEASIDIENTTPPRDPSIVTDSQKPHIVVSS